MSQLYDIYTHPNKGAWGVALNGQTLHCVSINGGNFQEERWPGYKLAAEVTKRMRMGFTKATRAKYLCVAVDESGKTSASFVDKHPELFPQGGLVLFTTVSKSDDLSGLADLLEKRAESTDARPEQIAAWVASIRTAKDYFSAPRTHPVFALVLADWAIEERRLLVGAVDGMPTGLPKSTPKDWEDWLSGVFADRNCVRKTLDQLEWSVLNLIAKADVAHAEQADGDVTWFSSANGVTF